MESNWRLAADGIYVGGWRAVLCARVIPIPGRLLVKLDDPFGYIYMLQPNTAVLPVQQWTPVGPFPAGSRFPAGVPVFPD